MLEKNKFPPIDKTAFSVVSLEEADDDETEYWLSKTPSERLEALETLRQIFYGYDPNSTRNQRVFEVAERELKINCHENGSGVSYQERFAKKL